MTKPTYSIQPNGYTVVSLFSGCGGSCLGFKMAGFRVLYASEFVPAAQDTYRANHPDTYLDTRDVRQVTADEILAAIKLQPGQVDVLEGSPPCASFSTAGTREAGWGSVKQYSDTQQRTDDLFGEYARLLRGLQPRMFVAENVAGLVRGTAKGYFLEILAQLRECGYKVRAQVLGAQWLGVPQMRERLFFVGVRDDVQGEPVFPSPQTFNYFVADVLPNVLSMKYGGTKDNWRLARSNVAPTVVACGGSISPTGYFSGAAYVIDKMTHSKRRLTIDEVRVLCSFPADFVLTGTFEQQWERMGRSVPPLLMRALALRIQGELDRGKQ
jgi:DNA (cytosine-5)-methyltransferase 1